jgi:enamine deaminase RidA (YjgF/YER057c/UK114 family)
VASQAPQRAPLQTHTGEEASDESRLRDDQSLGMAGPVRISQAVATPTPSRWLFLAGQGPAAADGSIVAPGDIGGQLTQALDNLETVLAQAGSDLSHVLRLSYYTTDVDALLGVWPIITQRLADNRPASTLLGVARLAYPEMLIEIEATAIVP